MKSNNYLGITIEDTGIGIPTEDQSKSLTVFTELINPGLAFLAPNGLQIIKSSVKS
jgi:signal transduction histidine kinase